MQLCDECGAEIPNAAQFCGRCGRKIRFEDDIMGSTEQPQEVSTILEDSQDLTPDIQKEEKYNGTAFPSENSGEDKELKSHLALGPEGEKMSFGPEIETSQEQQEQYPTAEDDNEEPGHHEEKESTSSMLVEPPSEVEIPTNQVSADQSLSTQSPNSQQATQIIDVSSQKLRSQPASRCLLFSLVGLIALIGAIAAVVGLFHQNLPVYGGSSNVLSSSPENEILDPNGSSLTASVCINSSTPSSNVTNQGSSFTLTSSTGCSNVVALKANSTCLIFPSDGSNSHKFIVDVSNAALINSPYHLVFSIVDYTVPELYSGARQISIGLSEGSTGRNFSWFYQSGSVTVNRDERSGSMNVVLVTEKDANTLHIVGEWACGHQIKSS